MALTLEDRARVARGLMRYWSRFWTVIAISKAELLAAVGATDDWVEDNAASYNAALPQAARSNLSLGQKTLLLCVVAIARVSISALRQFLGEVD